MASNSKKTSAIRMRKAKPNRRNLKRDAKRFSANLQVLKSLADSEQSQE